MENDGDLATGNRRDACQLRVSSRQQTLARALARAIGGDFRRIQCTPDLLPSDISGLTYFNQRAQEFLEVPFVEGLVP